MTTLLVTRGDDFGSFPEADRAIVDAHDRGCLRNASIMAPAPSFAHAAELARTRPGLCLGLHVTMTCEWRETRWGPLCDPSEVPSLVGADGCFLPTTMGLFERGVVLDDLMRETRAQLAHARAAGVRIEYLDEHMGIAWVHEPGGRERFVDRLRRFAAEEGLLWHDDVAPAANAFHSRFAAHPRPATLADAIAALDGIEGTWLWMTHPAYAEGAIARDRLVAMPDERGAQARLRAVDTALLMAGGFAEACSRLGIVPASYPEVARRLRPAVRAGGGVVGN